MFKHPTTAAAMAILLAMAGLAQVSPTAASATCDSSSSPNADFEAYLTTTQPAADQFSASRLIQLFLFPGNDQTTVPALEDGTSVNIDRSTNGLDAYVHDFGCELSQDRKWCITGIPGADDITLDNGRLLQLQGRTDDWRVQFFDKSGTPVDQDVSEVSTEQQTDTLPNSDNWCRPEADLKIPADTQYAIVWLDSSEIVNEDGSLDATENLIPRGYHTQLSEGLPGPYTAKFAFNTCWDLDKEDNDSCD